MGYRTKTSIRQGLCQLARIAMAGEADSVSSLSALACHIGGPIDVNPGELTLVYGSTFIAS